jgi:uncharacterized membrane protein required for colicin V production
VILDIILLAFIGLSAFFGFRRGFVASVIRAGSTLLSILLAILLCRPLGRLFSVWFDGWGYALSVFVAIVILFIVFKIIFRLVSRFFARRKRKNEESENKVRKVVGKTDAILGLFFGIFYCLLRFCIIFGGLFLLWHIPGLGRAVDWLLSSSYVARWLYWVAVEIVAPMLFWFGSKAVGALT